MANDAYTIHFGAFILEGNKKTLKEAYDYVITNFFQKIIYIIHETNDITWCYFTNDGTSSLPWSPTADCLLQRKFHLYGFSKYKGWFWAKIVHANHQHFRKWKGVELSDFDLNQIFVESVEVIMKETDFHNYVYSPTSH